MERSKPKSRDPTKGIKEFKLPDAISRSTDRNGFTQIPNSFLRNPDISSKAKTILSILLSNKDGWTSHIDTMLGMMKEGLKVLKLGLTELEEHRYLLRIQFRDKKTKKWRGSFWAYTDVSGHFDYYKNKKIVESMGCEIASKFIKNEPEVENRPLANMEDRMDNIKDPQLSENQPQVENPPSGFRPTNNINYDIGSNIIKKEQKKKPLTRSTITPNDLKKVEEYMKTIIPKDKVCPYRNEANLLIFGKDADHSSKCIICDNYDQETYLNCLEYTEVYEKEIKKYLADK